MRCRQLVCAMVAAVLVFNYSLSSAASLNDNADIVLDGDFAEAGYQGMVSPNGIGPDALVGFAIYARNFAQLRAFSVELTWSGDAVLVTEQQEGPASGTSLAAATATINGAQVTIAPQSKLFVNELSIGEASETGFYRNYYALAGGSAPASIQHHLLYAAVFRTSSSFDTGSKFDVTATITLGDDTAAECTPVVHEFHVNAEPVSHFTLDVDNTGNTATVLFPADRAPMIDDRRIDPGDEIAVFTPRGECAGFGVWNNANCSITVWGDDPQVAGISGFASGEAYSFKVWDGSAMAEYDLDVSCSSGTDLYGVNRITVVETAVYSPPVTVSIPLAAGWNMISSDVVPADVSLTSIFKQVNDNLVIVKNGQGEVYWPEFGVDQIGEWRMADGYQVNMTGYDAITITGRQVNASNIEYNFNAGWNLVSYLGADNAAPPVAYSSILDRLIMVKNNSGQVYWPEYGIDQIGAMRRHAGYFLNVSASVAALQRPAVKTSPVYFTPAPPSDNNATIMISTGILPEVNSRSLQSGDEIGVFSPSGICIGAGVWQDENLAVTVWGDDSHTAEQDGIRTGESYRFRIWDSEAMTERDADASYLVGSAEYAENAIVVLESLVGEADQTGIDAISPMEFDLHQNSPNPFNPSTMIRFTIPVSGHVELTVYSALGEKIEVLVDNVLEPGTHEVEWHASQFASGVYFYRLTADGFSDTGRMMLIK